MRLCLGWLNVDMERIGNKCELFFLRTVLNKKEINCQFAGWEVVIVKNIKI